MWQKLQAGALVVLALCAIVAVGWLVTQPRDEAGTKDTTGVNGEPTAPGPAESAPAESNAQVDVILLAHGNRKIAVIKAVRAATGLGLLDAKILVEQPPQPVGRTLDGAAADALRREFEAAGATVRLEPAGSATYPPPRPTPTPTPHPTRLKFEIESVTNSDDGGTHVAGLVGAGQVRTGMKVTARSPGLGVRLSYQVTAIRKSGETVDMAVAGDTVQLELRTPPTRLSGVQALKAGDVLSGSPD